PALKPARAGERAQKRSMRTGAWKSPRGECDRSVSVSDRLSTHSRRGRRAQISLPPLPTGSLLLCWGRRRESRRNRHPECLTWTANRILVAKVATLSPAAAQPRLARRRARRAEIAAGPALVGAEVAATGAVKHDQGGVEILQHDLGRIFFLAVLVLVLARLQRALEINLRAFLQVLLDHPAKTLAEDHDPMPFGLLAPFAGRLVAPRLRGR